jgi:hypothetical protein
VLAFVGGLDVGLRWYPAVFRSTEWEFATIAITVASLPLLSIGIVALLMSALARDLRGLVGATGAVFGLLAAMLVGVLILFGLDVPIALRAVAAPGPRTEIMKTIARTVLMGGAFLVLYIGGSIVALRYAFGRARNG